MIIYRLLRVMLSLETKKIRQQRERENQIRFTFFLPEAKFSEMPKSYTTHASLESTSSFKFCDASTLPEMMFFISLFTSC
jgi:hypothetical protein